jgi:hypothetical protein
MRTSWERGEEAVLYSWFAMTKAKTGCDDQPRSEFSPDEDLRPAKSHSSLNALNHRWCRCMVGIEVICGGIACFLCSLCTCCWLVNEDANKKGYATNCCYQQPTPTDAQILEELHWRRKYLSDQLLLVETQITWNTAWNRELDYLAFRQQLRPQYYPRR